MITSENFIDVFTSGASRRSDRHPERGPSLGFTGVLHEVDGCQDTVQNHMVDATMGEASDAYRAGTLRRCGGRACRAARARRAG
jgi:hypothetical protein